MTDREIPWEELAPETQEQFLVCNRALFQDPNWTPPEGYMIGVTTIPADFWAELWSDEPRCPTKCDSDCDIDCHENHQVTYKRHHDPETCPGATESGLRKDLDALLQFKPNP